MSPKKRKTSASPRAICLDQDCLKIACFGYGTEISYCNVHKLEGMIWTLTKQTVSTRFEPQDSAPSPPKPNEGEELVKSAWCEMFCPKDKKPKASSDSDSAFSSSAVSEIVQETVPNSSEVPEISTQQFVTLQKGKHKYGLVPEYFAPGSTFS